VGRHASATPEAADTGRRSPLAAWSARGAVAVVLVLAFAAGIGLSFLDPSRLLRALPGTSDGEACPSVLVTMVVAPEISAAIAGVVAPLQAHRVDGGCLAIEVRAQNPLQTIASASVLPKDRLPQLWIPDSSLWLGRTGQLSVSPQGSVASSPIVVAARPAEAKALQAAGSWNQTLDGSRSIALLHPDSSAIGLFTLAAVAGTAGRDKAGPALAATVHAIALDGSTTAMEALDALQTSGRHATRIAIVSEQSVVHAQAGSQHPEVVPVYPAPGSPTLDYPLVRIGETTWSAGQRDGAALITSALLGEAGARALGAEGFRTPEGLIANPEPLVVPEEVEALPRPEETALASIAALLTELAPPTRMLAVLDISTSMKAPVKGGHTRVELVRDVVKVASAALADDSKVGVWLFASELDGKKDYLPVIPMRRLDAEVGAGTQRDVIVKAAGKLPGQLVTGGTSLYDTAYAAIKDMVSSYDPDAGNAVVIITDGVNEDSTGLKLKEVRSKLRKLTKEKPVRIIAIAVGPDTDLKALSKLAGATPHGKAYKVLEASQLQAVLFDALSSRG
jgi:Ca-activated chloride channel family protein